MENPAQRWLQLLRDPCAGNLVQPCYTGTDAGYLVRTTDNISLSATGAGLAVGATYACSAFMSYSPTAMCNIGLGNQADLCGAYAPGGADPVTVLSAGEVNAAITTYPMNFINGTNSPVYRFRPVAACLRWVPTGPYGTRSGVVSLGYSAGNMFNRASTVFYTNVQSLMQHYAPNGSEPHEVRWLPTIVDERFTTNDASPVGGGTIGLMLRGVDGVAASATAVSINGFVEVTTVWEWTPAPGSGLVLAPKLPPPYTTQDVISGIRDLGSFLFEGAGSVAYGLGQRLAAGTIRGGAVAVGQMLTRGVGKVGNRSPTMLISG
jgi:hypothetical protein